MAAVPFSGYGRGTQTLANCEVGCSSSIICSGEEVFSRRCKTRRNFNFGVGSRRTRIFSWWSSHVGLWDCQQRRRRRDIHSVWEDCFSSQDLSNFSICKFCCHGEEYGNGGVRAQHIGFGRRVGALSSGIRDGSLRNFSVATFGREALAGRTRKGFRSFKLYAALDPYEVLGVPRTATDKEIKQAYRKLALKVHPDVNKEPDAQQKFLRVKNAYQTLSDEKSRAKYDASKRSSQSWDPFSWESERRSTQREEPEEEFYGFGDFVRDLSVSIEDFFRDLQTDSRRQASKPKSLWEELADIGEEFVEFLEKELNINETTAKEEKPFGDEARNARDTKKKSAGPAATRDQEEEKAQVEDEIAEIEDMLAQLKKELGI
ncbi:unnamed protein product [Calypogeia fissa]